MVVVVIIEAGAPAPSTAGTMTIDAIDGAGASAEPLAYLAYQLIPSRGHIMGRHGRSRRRPLDESTKRP